MKELDDGEGDDDDDDEGEKVVDAIQQTRT